MKLKEFYEAVRELEELIIDDFAIIVSRKTEDGGPAGVLSEASRRNAALRIAGDFADLATPEQTKLYYEADAAAREKAAAEAAKSKVTFTVVSAEDLRKVDSARNEKG